MIGGMTVSMPHAALFVVQVSTLEYWRPSFIGFNAARGFVCGARFLGVPIDDELPSFNAARGFVCGARVRFVVRRHR